MINHNSFILNDKIDTNAKCKTEVTVQYIDFDTIKRLRKKHASLNESLTVREMSLLSMKMPVLDYIIADPVCRTHFFRHKISRRVIHNYVEQDQINRLTVKLKNAIMVHWLKVKAKRNRFKFAEVAEAYRAKKKMEKEDPY